MHQSSGKQVLLIDDFREETMLKCQISLIARNYWMGIAALEKLGPWDLLLLDHDLNSFDPDVGKEYTGYDIMCFLETNPHLLPKKTKLVTDNSAGRKRMALVLDKLYGGPVWEL